MGFLLISIISSITITLIFKLITRRKVDIFSSIVVNYFIASLLGFVFTNFSGGFFLTSQFLLASLLIGILFIVTFYLVGLSTEKAGMGITTVASKVSLVIPITASFLLDKQDQFSIIKLSVLALAVLSVVFSTYQNKEAGSEKTARIALPLLLFICAGATDSTVKIAQLKVVPQENTAAFSALSFLISALIGLAVIISTRRLYTFKKISTWKYGSILGMANFGSLLFLMFALHSKIPSSIIFSVNNVSIVFASVLIGAYIFKEKLTTLNKIGIAISAVSLIYLSII